MSTVLLERLFTGREATMDERERRYVELYLIRTTSISEDPREVWNTSGLPRGGDSFGTDLGAVVRSIQVRLHVPHDWQYWIATVTFSTKPFDPFKPGPPAARGGFNDNAPTDELPTYSTSGMQREVATLVDSRGKVYQNSAGQPFPATKEVCTFVLDIDRPVAQTDQAQQYSYLRDGGAVNNDAVFSIDDVGKWRLAQWNSSKKWKNGSSYFQEKLALHYRGENWRDYRLDKGFWHRVNTGTPTTSGGLVAAAVRALDIYGNGLGDAILLDGRGNKLSDIKDVSQIALSDSDTVIFLFTQLLFPSVGSATQRASGLAKYEDTADHQMGLYVRLDDEVMQVTAMDNDTMTVTRGKRGTVAAAHADNVLVYMDPVFNEFIPYTELPFSVLNINWSIAGGI